MSELLLNIDFHTNNYFMWWKCEFIIKANLCSEDHKSLLKNLEFYSFLVCKIAFYIIDLKKSFC